MGEDTSYWNQVFEQILDALSLLLKMHENYHFHHLYGTQTIIVAGHYIVSSLEQTWVKFPPVHKDEACPLMPEPCYIFVFAMYM